MNICLDARVGTLGGTSTFINGFVSELSRTELPHNIDFVVGHGQKLPVDSNYEAPPGDIKQLVWSQTQLPYMLRKKEYDAYHSLKHLGPILGGKCKKIYRVPAVGGFDGTYPLSKAESCYWYSLGRQVYRNADLLIAVSDYVRDGLIEHLGISPEKVKTVNNGIDPFYALPKSQSEHSSEDVHPSDPSTVKDVISAFDINGPYFLCVANIGEVKNHLTSIKAFLELSSSHPELELILAGTAKGAYAESVRELIDRYNNKNKIKLIGFHPREIIRSLYNSAVALVHPSLHEGFSLTVLEAISTGLPIIGTQKTSVSDAGGSGGVYIEDPYDFHFLAQHMKKLLEDREFRSQLSSNAVTHSKKYSWSNCVNQTFAAYTKLL